MNRTLRRLAEDGILDVQRGRATILDLGRLQDVAGFDEDFLLHHYAPSGLRQELEKIVAQDPATAQVRSNGRPWA